MLDELVYWHWLILGTVLLILELTTGGGFLFWIGFAAYVVAFVTAFFSSISWMVQFSIFSLSAIAICIAWWHFLKRCPTTKLADTVSRRSEKYIGQTFFLESAIENNRGRVKIGDTIWRVSGENLPVGSQVKVTGVDGVLLHVIKCNDK